MPVAGALIGVAGSIGGGLLASKGSQKAADTAAAGSAGASAEAARQFNLVRQDTAPYRQIGEQALNSLGSIYGYAPAQKALSYDQWAQQNPNSLIAPPGPHKSKTLARLFDPTQAFKDVGLISSGGKAGDPNAYGQSQYQNYLQNFDSTPANVGQAGGGMTSDGVPQGFTVGQGMPATTGAGGASGGPDYSAFFKSPDYQFRKNEGMQGIGNSFSASGGAKSGNALKALADFNSNLAAGEFGNYFNRQAALAGIGQTANGQSGSAGIATGQIVGNALQNGGDARASGIAGQYNAIGQGLSGAGQSLGYYLQNRQRNPYLGTSQSPYNYSFPG